MHYTHQYASPLGDITMASNGESLIGLWFNGQKYFADTLPAENREKELPIFEQTASWLGAYFRGEIPDFMPALHLDGSPFRQMVWEILLQIPHGKVVTYGDIARMIASKTGQKTMSAQAVGGAVGHNPVSIIVPCHRVVGTSGSLTGYAGGIDKKIALLSLEKVDMVPLFIPKKGTAI
ncbi:methylated-DNA--[protein]-cysteine S-methyltransferase [Oxalobacter formigenes]